MAWEWLLTLQSARMVGQNGHWLCDVNGLVEGALSADGGDGREAESVADGRVEWSLALRCQWFGRRGSLCSCRDLYHFPLPVYEPLDLLSQASRKACQRQLLPSCYLVSHVRV